MLSETHWPSRHHRQAPCRESASHQRLTRAHRPCQQQPREQRRAPHGRTSLRRSSRNSSPK
eukprot:607182-Prymnesium_polylepis.1